MNAFNFGKFLIIFLMFTQSAVAQQLTGNLALRRPTFQSSTGWGGFAGRAVDGNTNGHWGARSCTHTHNQRNASWTVVLAKSTKLGEVRLFNRIDCCWARLRNISILVSNNHNGPYTVVATAAGGIRGMIKIPIAANKPAGRFVRVQIAHGYLTLCEVQVFGRKTIAPSVSANNLALRRPTFQSSTGWGGFAGRAVDGNTNGHWGARSCTHTYRQRIASWTVVLAKSTKLGEVRLFNRIDCCWMRLRNISILVSNNHNGPYTVVATAAGGIRGMIRIPIAADKPAGRFVRVQIPNNYLTLCEVQVFGRNQLSNNLASSTDLSDSVSGTMDGQLSNNLASSTGLSDSVSGTMDGETESDIEDNYNIISFSLIGSIIGVGIIFTYKNYYKKSDDELVV